MANLRHSDSCIKITYNDLIPGDKVWVQGELFEINNIFGYKDSAGRVIIRFTGDPVYGYNNLIGTGFASAIYGARSEVRCAIVKRAIN